MATTDATFHWTESDLREVEANYRDEVSSLWMYSTLAGLDPDPARAAVFRELSAFEKRHAGLWEGLLRSQGRPLPKAPPLFEHRVLVRMAKLLGVRAVFSLLHRQEVDGIGTYQDQAARWRTPEAQKIFQELLPDEVAHEIETFNSVRSAGGAAGGSLRSVLLGSIDGFASLVALSAGVAGITNSSHTVLIAGSASVIAGALSMSASEYVSVKAENEARSAQAKMEREAMEAAPETKKRQLVEAYVEKGFTTEEAKSLVDRLSGKPAEFLRSLLAERLGILEGEEEPAGKQGLLTGISFALAGALPLLPFLFLHAGPATVLSVLLTGGALFFAGLFRALSSVQPFLRSGAEMLVIGMGSAAGTFLIGLLIGSAVGG